MAHFHSKFFEAYDEDGVLLEYIKRHLDHYITHVEYLALTVADLEERRKGDEPFTDGSDDWINKQQPEVLDAAKLGTNALWSAVRQRVLEAVERGELSITRCPSCNRIVRTPSAQQCLWCNHDWHHMK